MANPHNPPCEMRLFGDWGNSRLRLWLVRGDTITPWREGPGIGALDRPATDTLQALVAELPADARPAKIVLCGMAGARGGLREAGYVESKRGKHGFKAAPASCTPSQVESQS